MTLQGQDYIAYDISETFIKIGALVFASLPFFHAFKGAENTSVFFFKKQDIRMGSVEIFSYQIRIICLGNI